MLHIQAYTTYMLRIDSIYSLQCVLAKENILCIRPIVYLFFGVEMCGNDFFDPIPSHPHDRIPIPIPFP